MKPSTLRQHIVSSALGVVLLSSPGLAAAQPATEQGFTETVRPFVRQHCTGCHGGASPAAQFDLERYETVEAVVEDHARWELIMERLDAGEMNMFRILQELNKIGFDGCINPDHIFAIEGDVPGVRQGAAYAVGYIKALLAALYA